MRPRRPLLVLAICLVGACAPGAGHASADERITASIKAESVAAQRAHQYGVARILADGRVTKAEYERAFGSWRRCLDRLGVDVETPMLSPLDGVRLVADTKARQGKVDAGKGMACLDDHLGRVEAAYAMRPRPMAGPLRRAIVSCLRARGYQVGPSDRTIDHFARMVGDEHIGDLSECIDAVIYKLYPGLPGYSLGGPSHL